MRNIYFQEFPTNRRFGVELEISNNISKLFLGKIVKEFEQNYGNLVYNNTRGVLVTNGTEGWAQSRLNNYWHVKFDRTCGPIGNVHGVFCDYGWEIASFIGNGINDVYRISHLAHYLRRNGAKTNLNCGLHIHVEAHDYSSPLMGILLARWLKIEDLLIRICHPVRNENEYCRSMRHRYECLQSKLPKFVYTPNYPEGLWYLMYPSDLSSHHNPEKRFTLNTIGFAECTTRNTIELRLPECKLDELHVKNWIRLYVNFVETCRKSLTAPQDIKPTYDLNEVLTLLGLQDNDGFVILDRELAETKIWFMQKLMKITSVNQEAKKHLEFMTQLC